MPGSRRQYMHSNVKRRLVALGLAASIAVGGIAVTALPATAASAAATAFSNCMNPYLNVQRIAYQANKDKIGTAILYTGYARCYYNLSQRTDITGQQEIDAINNFNFYYAKANIWIAKAGVDAYEEYLFKYNLKGLKGL